jgi:hypothetical protein
MRSERNNRRYQYFVITVRYPRNTLRFRPAFSRTNEPGQFEVTPLRVAVPQAVQFVHTNFAGLPVVSVLLLYVLEV